MFNFLQFFVHGFLEILGLLHRQTDRQTDGQTDRQTDGQTDGQTKVESDQGHLISAQPRARARARTFLVTRTKPICFPVIRGKHNKALNSFRINV